MICWLLSFPGKAYSVYQTNSCPIWEHCRVMLGNYAGDWIHLLNK